MENLKAFSAEDLHSLVRKRKLETYRGNQIFQWIWQKGILDIGLMTNLSSELRHKISKEFYIGTLKLVHRLLSDDGSVKYVFELEDGKIIESVYMPEDDRVSVCVSVQVGCPLGCLFCATGHTDFERNLLAWEIADQVIFIQRYEKTRITNVVFMGMGEPLLNIEAVLNACNILNNDYGPNIGARRMTISTAGIPSGIDYLSRFAQQVRIALSLNATTDSLRNRLMPINRKYPITSVIDAIRHYQLVKNRMVTIEYVMFEKLNIFPEDARRLIKLVRDLRCKINLIPYNPVPNCNYLTPSDVSMRRFFDILINYDKAVTIRKSRGFDVDAACGQLRSTILLKR